ncbi:flagellar basal body-associated FliL family protein [Bordetella genomosp. 13]|uniref:Flagellar protein FliL n=1 Tax=Bordetella genomosp. 13 TaxID=463040 RepID=A0A1W6ZA75_9BORD|nr:flagellar basal body-associated FliL family protein [Bordetella genomosp. 13]ARP94298.1 flagellar basal body protein FliL [Bordetella genomosp. 13]
MATTKIPSAPRAASSSGGIGRLLRPLLMLLALLAVAAASVAATWFFMNWQAGRELSPVQIGVGGPGQAQAAGAPGAQPTTFVPPPTAPVQVPAPIFIPLEPFTATVEDPESERIVRVGITLRVSDEQSRTRIEKYLPEVRSRVLMVLSAQTPQTVRTPQGKADMAKAIMAAVNKPFSPIPDGQYVSDVLFTEFVVQ